MPIYKVEIVCHNIIEVEAKDEDQAHDKAVEQMGSDSSWMEALESTIELADCQYTARQELADREQDHEGKESNENNN